MLAAFWLAGRACSCAHAIAAVSPITLTTAKPPTILRIRCPLPSNAAGTPMCSAGAPMTPFRNGAGAVCCLRPAGPHPARGPAAMVPIALAGRFRPSWTAGTRGASPQPSPNAWRNCPGPIPPLPPSNSNATARPPPISVEGRRIQARKRRNRRPDARAPQGHGQAIRFLYEMITASATLLSDFGWIPATALRAAWGPFAGAPAAPGPAAPRARAP